MKTKPFNSEVLYPDEAIVKVDRTDVAELKARAEQNVRKRMRLCAHRGTGDSLHEMLIVLSRNTYIRPHKHLNKSESFHVIEGAGNIVLFDDDGKVTDVINMGDYASGHCFYYRITDTCYHTLVIQSDILVFHETTRGPFLREQTVFAPWSPVEGDAVAIVAFMDKLRNETELNRKKTL